MSNPFGDIGDIFGGLDIGKVLEGMSDEELNKTAAMLGMRCKCGETRNLKTWPPTRELVCGACHMQKAIEFASQRRGA